MHIISSVAARFVCFPLLALLLSAPSHLFAEESTPSPAKDAAAPGQATTEDGFQELLNGQDLSGWEGQPGWWKVEEGVLVCESTPEKPCQRSHYLNWTAGEPADFELRVLYRIHGEGNSGIQFRSDRRPEFDIWGYQADLDTAGVYTGCLYQHDRGLVAGRGERVSFDKSGEKTSETFADSQALLKATEGDDWNEYRIVAQGAKIKLWINGKLMCEVEDHDPKLSTTKGLIALQMHQGPPMKIEYKSVRLRSLDADTPIED
ncbi:3-keto-disaccharide hydrolase [Aeoliella mucimassa]|uniref:3-keto-alpha-glucoside-1,2-lyase/3-keto-2-hydroxy-glucal hydratase domain-containing protein n=1 Tax=Aeoliella mucimassa TaxID=2527972 RepID=A0A518AVP1_9BACT|nr:DUF1080 domain-containing protein [Aeoliella mucimassa]QDU58807.1 hypothetical protein Pan181_50470 [Aeoliella mucimassa]